MVLATPPFKKPETLGDSAPQLIKGIFILFSVLKAWPLLSLPMKGLKTQSGACNTYSKPFKSHTLYEVIVSDTLRHVGHCVPPENFCLCPRECFILFCVLMYRTHSQSLFILVHLISPEEVFNDVFSQR